MSRAARLWTGLLLLGLVTGCVSIPGERMRFPVSLAMSNELSPGDVFTGPVVHGYNVPGRNPDSEMPWKFFLGHAAHRLIAYIYGVNHPRNRVFYNKDTLVGILRGEGGGHVVPFPSRSTPSAAPALRPTGSGP